MLQPLHGAFQLHARPGAGAARARPAAGTGEQHYAADQEVGHDQHGKRAADQQRRGAGHRHLRCRRAQGGGNFAVARQYGSGKKADPGQLQRTHVDGRQLPHAGPIAGEPHPHLPAPVRARQHFHRMHRQPLAAGDRGRRAELRAAAHHDARQHRFAGDEPRGLELHLLHPFRLGPGRRPGAAVFLRSRRRQPAPRRGDQGQPCPAAPAPSAARRHGRGHQHAAARRRRERCRKNDARAAPGSSPVAISSRSTPCPRQPLRISRKCCAQ